MPESPKSQAPTTWWKSLGLTPSSMGQIRPYGQREQDEAVNKLLTAHPPVAFVGDAPGETLSLAQLVSRLEHAADNASREAEQQLRKVEDENRRHGWAKVEEALTDPALADVLTTGRWGGFTLGEAIAWCWNLFQYEPVGGTHTKSQLRYESMQALEAGQPPAVFGYPERARALADRGVNPREYRKYREALGEAVAPALYRDAPRYQSK